MHKVHKRDLPNGLDLGRIVAIDCETMGLNPHRDRVCCAAFKLRWHSASCPSRKGAKRRAKFGKAFG